MYQVYRVFKFVFFAEIIFSYKTQKIAYWWKLTNPPFNIRDFDVTHASINQVWFAEHLTIYPLANQDN